MKATASEGSSITQVLGDQHVHLPPSTASAVVVVRTLPRDVATFTGRHDEVESLLAASERHGVVAIHAVEGMPSVGKTALVTHAAHRLADRYPDGQLFVGLNAHAPGLAAADPGEVLYGLLAGAGMQASQIPPGLQERARLWRDRMAGRRVLLFLDDAAGREQIEPLLPGAPGCLVLITSRRPIDLDDAQALPLEVLPSEEALSLFTRLAGQTFIGEQADQAAKLVAWCAGLPLAIVLLARKVHRQVRQPGGGLGEIVARFTDADRLAQLAPGGRPGDRAVALAFEMSYRDLPSTDRNRRRSTMSLSGSRPASSVCPSLQSVGTVALCWRNWRGEIPWALRKARLKWAGLGNPHRAAIALIG